MVSTISMLIDPFNDATSELPARPAPDGSAFVCRIERMCKRGAAACCRLFVLSVAVAMTPDTPALADDTQAAPDRQAGISRRAGEHWEAARRAVKQDAAWRQWLAERRKVLDAWMAVPHDDEAWVAGWAHDYQDAATGAFLAWTPDADCSRAGKPDSPSWRACVAMLRHQHMDRMREAARLAMLTGDAAYADWAGEQLDRYVRLYARQSGPAAGAVLFRQTLDEANVMPVLADTVRLLRGGVPRERSEAWCRKLLLPIAERLRQAQKEVHNIAVWHTSAVAIAGLECGDAALTAYARQGPWSLPALLSQGVSADGFWFELSISYQNYVLRALNEVLLAFAVRGVQSGDDEIAAQARRLLTGPYAVQFSEGDGPTINDSNRNTKIPDEALLLAVRRVLPTETGVDLARRERDWDGLLDPPGMNDMPIRAPPPAEGARAVAGLKSLFLRAGQWQALLRAGQGARHHAHQDALTLELKHGATWILRNSATPAYGSELHRKYYKLAAAHDTPLIDGKGVSNWFASPAGTVAKGNAIEADFTSFQRGMNVRRTVAVAEGELEDRLDFSANGQGAGMAGTTGTIGTIGTVYHTDCRLADMSPPGLPAAIPDAPGFQVFRGVGAWAADGRRWTARLDCGGKIFDLRMQASTDFRVTQASAPALGPARQRLALIVDMAAPAPAWLSIRLCPADGPRSPRQAPAVRRTDPAFSTGG